MLNLAVCINKIGWSEMPTGFFFSQHSRVGFFVYTKNSDLRYIFLQSSCVVPPAALWFSCSNVSPALSAEGGCSRTCTEGKSSCTVSLLTCAVELTAEGKDEPVGGQLVWNLGATATSGAVCL